MTWLSRASEGEENRRQVLADYETEWRQRIDEKAKLNPYPFKSWFPNGNRVYIPMSEASAHPDNDDLLIMELLREAGYQTNLQLYREGYVLNRGGNRVRLAKVLRSLLESEYKQKVEKIRSTYQDKIDNGFDPEIMSEEMDRSLEHARQSSEDMFQVFVNSSFRSGKTSDMVVVISQDPHDVAKMSTDRGWTSCMDLDSGQYRENVVCEVEAGSLIAYVIRADDVNIEKPLARIHIKRYEDLEGNSYAVQEDTAYGADIAGFDTLVKSWLDERQGDMPIGFYKRKGGSYSDSLDEDVFVLPTNLDKLKDIVVNGTDEAEKMISWNVIVDESLEDTDMYSEEPLSFSSEEEAQNWIDNHSYDETWRDYYGGEWAEENEDGEYIFEPYSIEKNVSMTENDIKIKAANKILEEEDVKDLPDELLLAIKQTFNSDTFFGVQSQKFIRKIYFSNKRNELLTPEEIKWFEGNSNFLTQMASEVNDMEPGPEKKEAIDNLVSNAQDTLQAMLADPVGNVNHSSRGFGFLEQYRTITEIFDSIVVGGRSASDSGLFNRDNQIPPNIVDLMIGVSKNAKSIEDKISSSYNEKMPYHFVKNIVTQTLRVLSSAQSDIPQVKRWYRDLLNSWGDDLGPEGLPNRMWLNIYTLGQAIASLGPDNGAEFIPFIKKRMDDVSIQYKSSTDDRRKRAFKGLYNEYVRILEKITPQTTASSANWLIRAISNL